MNNFEKIKRMELPELYELLNCGTCRRCVYNSEKCGDDDTKTCSGGLLEWLLKDEG